MATRKGAKRPKRERVSFRLPAPLFERLRKFSDDNNYIMTSVVEDMLRYGLDRLEAKNSKVKSQIIQDASQNESILD